MISQGQAQEVTLASFDTNSQTGGANNFGASPLSPLASDPNVTVAPLTRATGVTTTGTGAARGFGGVGWNVADAAAAVTAMKYLSFGVTPNAGFKVSFTQIDRFDYRRSGTGATSAVIQYQVGTGAFVDLPALSLTVSASAGASLGPIDLTSVADLQNVPGNTPVTFRVVPFAASGSGGTFYIFDVANTTAADLSIKGTVSVTGGTPPTITSFTPASGPPGTSVTITGTLFGAGPTVSFNGTAAPGATVNPAGTSISVNAPAGGSTGPITVTTAANGSVTSSTPFTYPAAPLLDLAPDATSFAEDSSVNITVSRPVDAPLASALTVSLSNSAPAKATIPASVIIPANQTFAPFVMTGIPDGVYAASSTTTITASAPGYVNATTTLTITNIDAPPSAGPSSVVVNKYFNSGSTADTIELLVIGNGAAGTTLDMRGMILKDFSGSMVSDGGGKYVFADNPLLAAVKVGTLLVVDVTGSSSDTSYTDSNDFTLRLALTDTAFFTKSGTGLFDISTTDMIMIKAATVGGVTTDAAGVIGSLHVLAAGAAGAQYDLVAGNKLIASATTATSRVVIANNSTSSLTDYNGTDATGGLAQTDAAGFGNYNNATNETYIRTLRGITSISGTGLASIANATTASPYLSKNIFARNGTAQKVAVTFTGTSASPALGGVKISVPAAFGVPTVPNVATSGAGAGTPVITITGQDIKITGTAITPTNTLTVTISGLITPNPTALTDDSGYLFPMQTSESGTTFLPISLTPVAAVLIPISALRDVDASGISLDRNKIVAIQGVCTEAQFSNNAAGDTTAFIQDGDFGIGLFAAALNLNLERGKVYAISGPLSQFNGLTQLLLSAANPVIDLGAGTEPTPLTVTLADLFANAELYEGRVIKVRDLGNPVGSWGLGSTVTLSDPTPTTLDIRIQAGSAASTPPASFPANITGILSQFDSSNPFTAGYQLMPRDAGDIEVSIPPSGYDAWALAYPGIGAVTDDFDGDGQSNYLEYALGTDPTLRSSAQQPNLAPIGGKPAISFNKGSAAGSDPLTAYTIEGSTNLSDWTVAAAGSPVLESFSNDSSLIQAQYLGTSGKYYFRLKVGPPPGP